MTTMQSQGTNDHLLLLSFGEDGRLTSACAARTLADLYATEADLAAHLRPARRPRRTVHLDRAGAQAA